MFGENYTIHTIVKLSLIMLVGVTRCKKLKYINTKNVMNMYFYFNNGNKTTMFTIFMESDNFTMSKFSVVSERSCSLAYITMLMN